MLLSSMKNLYLTVKLTVIALWKRVPGWSYPFVTNTNRFDTFPDNGDITELVLFNKLKHHTALHDVLKHTKSPFVLVVGIRRGTVVITGYRLVEDDNGSDLMIPTLSTPGVHGTFYYHHTQQGFFHARRPTSVTRKMGFYDSDPIFQVKMPMDARTRDEIGDLQPTHNA